MVETGIPGPDEFQGDDIPIGKSMVYFNIPEDVPIIPVIATEKNVVFKAFELLVEKNNWRCIRNGLDFGGIG